MPTDSNTGRVLGTYAGGLQSRARGSSESPMDANV